MAEKSLQKSVPRFLFRGNAPINWVRKWKNTPTWKVSSHKKKIEARLDLRHRRTNTGQRKSKVPDLVIPSIAPLARKPRFETLGNFWKILRPRFRNLARRRRENFWVFGRTARGKRYFRGPKKGPKLRPRSPNLAEKTENNKTPSRRFEIFRDFQP